MSRYPHQLALPSDYKCVLEEDGGILLATKAVDALQVHCYLLSDCGCTVIKSIQLAFNFSNE